MRDYIDISNNDGSEVLVNSTKVVVQYQQASGREFDAEVVKVARARFLELPTDLVPDRTVAPPRGGFHGVAAANPEFVGREEDLKTLATAVIANSPVAIGPVASAAAGIGGIGKTQLVNEFAHRYGQYFDGGVFWISFADAALVPNEIARHGGARGLDLRPDYSTLPLDAQVALVSSAWQSELPRLLIFDNCEDEDLFHAWRPPTGNSRILLTCRNTLWSAASGVSVHSVDTLPRARSIELLLKHRPEFLADDPDLDRIAEALGDLPLALHLAGGYLREYAGEAFATPAAYLEEIARDEVLSHPSLTGDVDGQSPTEHDRHVGRTFLTSLRRLNPGNEIDQLALSILGRAASLAPGEPIPVDLLREQLADAGALDRDAVRRRRDAHNRTLRLGLLAESGERRVQMHRLVGHYIRANFEGTRDEQIKVAEILLLRAEQINEDKRPAPMAELLPHLRHLAETAANHGMPQAGTLLNELGLHLITTADYAGAKLALERALSIDVAIKGPDHRHIAIRCNNLASVLRVLGDLKGAKLAAERAVRIDEINFGLNHHILSYSLNTLGLILQDDGDLKGAKIHFERALEICEAAFGPDHSTVATSVNNLALVSHQMGDLEKAKTASERSLEITETTMGLNHPDVAIRVNNLGGVLQSLGDLDAAKKSFNRALKINETTYGVDHPSVAVCANNLGGVLQEQGEFESARVEFERALQIYEATFGVDHPLVANYLTNLAGSMQNLGDYESAKDSYERALVIDEAAYGADHAKLIPRLTNLGRAYHDLRELNAAKIVFERALAIGEAEFSRDHINIAYILNDLGLVLRHMGDNTEAKRMYKRAVLIYETHLGFDHRDTMVVRENLSKL